MHDNDQHKNDSEDDKDLDHHHHCNNSILHNVFIPSVNQVNFINYFSAKKIVPINTANFKLERSVGFNADLNCKSKILNNNVALSFNQLFFLTWLKNSLILEQRNQSYEFVNADKTLSSIGFETNLKLEYKDFTLFTNYVFNDVKLDENQKALTPKLSFGGVLMSEVENNLRICYEANYKGS